MNANPANNQEAAQQAPTGYADLLNELQQNQLYNDYLAAQNLAEFFTQHNNINIQRELRTYSDCTDIRFIKFLYSYLNLNYEQAKEAIASKNFNERTLLESAIAKAEKITFKSAENQQQLENDLKHLFDYNYSTKTHDTFNVDLVNATTANEMHKLWSNDGLYRYFIISVERLELPLEINVQEIVDLFEVSKQLGQEVMLLELAKKLKPGYMAAYGENYPYNGELFDNYTEQMRSIYIRMTTTLINGHFLNERQGPFVLFRPNVEFERLIDLYGADHASEFPGVSLYLAKKAAGNSGPIFSKADLEAYFEKAPADKVLFTNLAKVMHAFSITFNPINKVSIDKMVFAGRGKVILLYYYYEKETGPSKELNFRLGDFLKGILPDTKKDHITTVAGFARAYASVDMSKEDLSELLYMSWDGLSPSSLRGCLTRLPSTGKNTFITFIITLANEDIISWFGEITQAYLRLLIHWNAHQVRIGTLLYHKFWKKDLDTIGSLSHKQNCLLKIILSNGAKANLDTNFKTFKELFFSDRFNYISTIGNALNDAKVASTVKPDGTEFHLGDELFTLNDVVLLAQTLVTDSYHYKIPHYSEKIRTMFKNSPQQLRTYTLGLGLNPSGWDDNPLQDNNDPFTQDRIAQLKVSHSRIAPKDIPDGTKMDWIRFINQLELPYDAVLESYNKQRTAKQAALYERNVNLVGMGYVGPHDDDNQPNFPGNPPPVNPQPGQAMPNVPPQQPQQQQAQPDPDYDADLADMGL